MPKYTNLSQDIKERLKADKDFRDLLGEIKVKGTLSELEDIIERIGPFHQPLPIKDELIKIVNKYKERDIEERIQELKQNVLSEKDKTIFAVDKDVLEYLFKGK